MMENNNEIKDKLLIVVDDDPDIASTISQYFAHKDFRVKRAADAESFFKAIKKEIPDIILLDINLPGTNGLEICKKLKEHEHFACIPIIMVSAKSSDIDKISGLEIGADDYMVKPFSLEELNARIKAVLRRGICSNEEKKIVIGGRMVMDLTRYEVTVDGEKVELTPTEFKILECLATRESQVFTRDRILDYLWGEEKVVVERTIDVHIKHLREKLGSAGEIIKNVRGIGYKIG